MKMRGGPGRLLIAGLAAAGLSACSHSHSDSGDEQVSAMWRNLEIEVVGTLVNVGECGVLVDHEGRKYGLVGNLDRYERGDRLRVSGPVAYWSACGTYSAIKAEDVDRQ